MAVAVTEGCAGLDALGTEEIFLLSGCAYVSANHSSPHNDKSRHHIERKFFQCGLAYVSSKFGSR